MKLQPRILIVEDEPAIAELIAVNLRHNGLSPAWSEDGDAAQREIDAAFSAILRQLISYMMEDPRTITAALEIVFIAKSIERIGDHAKNIAEAVVQVVKGKDVRHSSAEQIRAEVAQP